MTPSTQLDYLDPIHAWWKLWNDKSQVVMFPQIPFTISRHVTGMRTRVQSLGGLSNELVSVPTLEVPFTEQ